MIRLEDVGMRYTAIGAAPVDALRHIDLSIERGEYVALVGPSGSGKSTLMHIVGCLATPTSGKYLLNDVDVGDLDRNALARIRSEHVGFVFQRFHLLPRATALENVIVPLRFAGAPRGSRRERAAEILQRVGLADRLGHRPSELSGGQQQRVAIARALANHPDLLLADEPTGNLDSKAGGEIIELLEELHREGRTIVVVTHDDGIAGRAQRVLRMLDGEIVEDS